MRRFVADNALYTIEWAGWSRPLSYRIIRWVGDDGARHATGEGTIFAPLFWWRYTRVLLRRRRDFPRASVR